MKLTTGRSAVRRLLSIGMGSRRGLCAGQEMYLWELPGKYILVSDRLPTAHIRNNLVNNVLNTEAVTLLKVIKAIYSPPASYLLLSPYISFCLPPLLFQNAPARTTQKQTHRPGDPCQRFRLSASSPAGLRMGVLTDWVISPPFNIIHLHCCKMTNVQKAYWRLSSFWSAVILCAPLPEISLFSCHRGSICCCRRSDALIWRTRCDWIS